MTRGDSLDLWIGSHVAGAITRAKGDQVALTYLDEWRDAVEAIPLSVSLPLSRRRHTGQTVGWVLDALLPDDDRLRTRWAREAGVAPSDVVGLLGAVGRDLAGAVSLWPTGQDAPTDGVTWWTDEEFQQHIAAVRATGPQLVALGEGWFSLAGAQRKTALVYDGSKWGTPQGRTPTTHILKPAPSSIPSLARLEHFTLRVMSHLGLPTAESAVVQADDGEILVSRRYDRQTDDDGVVHRLHQEDACQMLGRDPTRRYESEGGPTGGDVARGLREASLRPADDLDVLMRVRAAHWALASTDGHARNTSVLHQPGGVRLAPVYDVMSAWGLEAKGMLRDHGPQLAMTIGTERLVRRVTGSDWRLEARACGVPGRRMMELVSATLASIPAAVAAAAEQLVAESRWDDALEEVAETTARAVPSLQDGLTR